MSDATTVEAAPPLRMTTGRWRRWLRPALMFVGVFGVGLAAVLLRLTGGQIMSTDDAYVQAALTSISSNIAGRVEAIDVRDNQHVHRGEVLFRLDDKPFRIAVESALAELGTVELQIAAGKSNYRKEQAAVKSAQDTVSYQQIEFQRNKRLLASGIASRAQYDQALHALETANQQLSSDEQQAASVLAMLGGNPNVDPKQHPAVQQAQAALDRAQLNLSYTEIRAPEDGIVTKVEQLQVGDYINAAAPVFALISVHDAWVEANFKEDQLSFMRAGQPATVSIDTYTGRRFKAHVASLSPGTGSQFSALPAENATGNWVKVVQRVPVRIEFDTIDPEIPLRSGLSAIVEVDTGHRRSLF